MTMTPGPWTFRGRVQDGPTIGMSIVTGYGSTQTSTRQLMPVALVNAEDDARLIAAAPEMLAALLAAHDWFDRERPPSRTGTLPLWLSDARAAIAKAMGDAS